MTETRQEGKDMDIAPLFDSPVAVRIRTELADAVEHYLAISRSADLFASLDYHEKAESAAWMRMMDAVAMADAVGVWHRDEAPGAAG